MLLNYKRSGQGPTVVLLHGLFGSLENLGMIRRGLHHNFDVVSVDLPDHGESPYSAQFSFDDYADAVFALMDHLAIERASVLGHSLGGKIAMTMALNHPTRVSSLIVADIAPVDYAPRHQQIFAGLSSVQLPSIDSRQAAESQMKQHISDAGVRQFLLRSLYQQGECWHWRFNLEMLIRDYSLLSKGLQSDHCYAGKCLFIKGELSDYLLPEHRTKIAELLPNSKAHVIESTGHWLHAEKPQIFNRIALKFLSAI